MALGDNSAKVLALYDNEWGYAQRVVDLASYVS
jgi:glyceraldehyde-3-phosphate dehydrogenase/erythrose-4-phosphate dehydrogenase